MRNTGSPNLGGSVATAGGLVFIGASNDSRFRAFNSENGKLLWETKLEASAHSNPITYLGRDGRQYVVIMAAGGGAFLGGGLSNSLVAYALPDVARKPFVVTTTPTSSAGRKSEQRTADLPSPSPLPAIGPKALVQRTCGTGCHSIDVVTSQRMTANQWNAVVASMIARGARASSAEEKEILEYLSKTFGPSRK